MDETKIRTGMRQACSRFPPSQAGDGVKSANFSYCDQGEYRVIKNCTGLRA